MVLPLALAALLLAAPTPTPRPIEEAIPAEATFALYEPHVRGDLLRAIGALEGLLGATAAEAFLSDAPLPFLSLEAAAGAPDPAIDARGGIGLFRIEGIAASAGLVSVRSPDRAIAELAEHLGARVQRHGELVWLVGKERVWGVLVDGGYLYLLIPDPQPPEAIADEVTPRRNTESLARAIRERKGTLAQSPMLRTLSPKVAAGQLSLFLSGFEPQDAIRGAFLRARIGENGATLDGVVAGKGPLFTATGKPHATLSRAAAPFGIAAFEARAGELAAFFLGPELSHRRQIARRLQTAVGIDFEALLASGAGPIAVGGYVTPPHHRAGDDFADPGTLGVQLQAPVKSERLASAWLRDLRHWAGPGASRGEVTRGLLHLTLGDVTPGAQDPFARARAQVGKDAFAPGHVTLWMDLTGLRQTLRARNDVASTEQLAQLDSLTEIDRAWLVLSGDPEGARVRGVLRLDSH